MAPGTPRLEQGQPPNRANGVSSSWFASLVPTNDANKIEPPSQIGWKHDLIEVLARAGLSAVPIAGGAAVELFQYATNQGRAARMQRWIEEVTGALNRHGVAIDSLADRDGFLDAIGPATRAAVETSSPEKIEALRNAVLNATIASDLATDRHAILMDILVGLTPTHVKLLKLFDDPVGWFASADIEPPRLMMGGQHAVVERAYPDLADDETLLNRVVNDLEQQGLSSIALRTIMSGDGVLSQRTRPLGKELLTFITESTA